MKKFAHIKRAKKSEAFIVYTFGIPHVSYNWTLVCPCFRYVHTVNVAYQRLRVDTDNLRTADGQLVGLTSIVTFRVDADSKQKVLKAYHEYSIAGASREDLVVDLSATVIEVITDIQEKAVSEMTLEELTGCHLVFADEIFTAAASALRENGVILAELKLLEIKEFCCPEEIDVDEGTLNNVVNNREFKLSPRMTQKKLDDLRQTFRLLPESKDLTIIPPQTSPNHKSHRKNDVVECFGAIKAQSSMELQKLLPAENLESNHKMTREPSTAESPSYLHSSTIIIKPKASLESICAGQMSSRLGDSRPRFSSEIFIEVNAQESIGKQVKLLSKKSEKDSPKKERGGMSFKETGRH